MKNQEIKAPEGRTIGKKSKLTDFSITNLLDETKQHEQHLQDLEDKEKEKNSEIVVPALTSESPVKITETVKNKKKTKENNKYPGIPEKFLKGDFAPFKIPESMLYFVKKKCVDERITITAFMIEAAYKHMITKGWVKEEPKQEEN